MSIHAIPILSLFLAASTALATPCKTEQEARADAVIGFFTTRQLAADLCEERLGFKGMVALRSQVKAKFRDKLDGAGKVREGFFQRTYGEKWKETVQMLF